VDVGPVLAEELGVVERRHAGHSSRNGARCEATRVGGESG
jgi:hypothetical protein